jgi:hypothetical protein
MMATESRHHGSPQLCHKNPPFKALLQPLQITSAPSIQSSHMPTKSHFLKDRTGYVAAGCKGAHSTPCWTDQCVVGATAVLVVQGWTTYCKVHISTDRFVAMAHGKDEGCHAGAHHNGWRSQLAIRWPLLRLEHQDRYACVHEARAC